MKKGDTVTIKDGSYARSVIDGKLVKGHLAYGDEWNKLYVVIEVGCRFPAVDKYQARDIVDYPASFNNTVIQALDSGKVVFIEERFLRSVLSKHTIMIDITPTPNRCFIAGKIVEVSDGLYREILRQKE